MKPWTIREERVEEAPAIAALTQAAFLTAPHSDGNEASIVEHLRAGDDLRLSLVLENADHAILGQAAFSPISISDSSARWFGLGPVSVIPSRQRSGVGSALVREGLERLRKFGARGCVVLGDPAYYGRFGFEHDPALAFPGPPPELFQRLVFEDPAPSGTVRYAPAFY